jgi:hypothetical protein
MEEWLASLAIRATGDRAQELFLSRRDMATTNALETIAIEVLSLPIPTGVARGIVYTACGTRCADSAAGTC